MAKKTNESSESEFRVALKGLNLNSKSEDALETAIRRVVMEQLAAIDHKGDLQVAAHDRLKSVFGPGIRGYYAEGKIASLATGGSHVLYGVIIRDALQRGDLSEMKQVAEQATATLGQQNEIRTALDELNNAIAKLGA